MRALRMRSVENKTRPRRIRRQIFSAGEGYPHETLVLHGLLGLAVRAFANKLVKRPVFDALKAGVVSTRRGLEIAVSVGRNGNFSVLSM